MRTTLTLDHAAARRALDAIFAELNRRGKAGSIAVADASGELIALLRMDGAKLSTPGIATNKAFTAAREQKRTAEIGEWLRDRNIDIAFLGDPRFCGFGGGVPVLMEGRVVGAIAVSGLSQAEDEELALLGVAAALATS